ncbi:MAG: GNAT family N-acetyltransferase [Candidatus Rokubacteria bacterium]|nr:GNAT family N-acetyltransferase [Candidatus Rokubacteria bacterium]MBI2155577.1 GNAT family N-acetyltransferase [Candidatus Rokubacteria bacterium]MBI2491850.1 GNAT family N-acetyltransferase [Candidatus Rokubacteria bacterium]MBI4255260.1 GNAT family N-acetyltransferase [Candidatus Rokubacteria bacterium]MBI4629829.1 GNAT family N-acetyltransferase [Candidatus Rokubacteria bacterium]
MAKKDAAVVRAVEPSDFDAILRIDEKLTAQTRKDYWRTRLDIAALRPPWMSSVAEMDGRLVGFLFGWVAESEFGMPGATAWIDLIGVDPAYRGRGVGQALVERFIGGGQELRAIRKVATLIDLGQADVREFFTRLGFHHGPMIHMEKIVTS